MNGETADCIAAMTLLMGTSLCCAASFAVLVLALAGGGALYTLFERYRLIKALTEFLKRK